jgi:hypothetical protein
MQKSTAAGSGSGPAVVFYPVFGGDFLSALERTFRFGNLDACALRPLHLFDA